MKVIKTATNTCCWVVFLVPCSCFFFLALYSVAGSLSLCDSKLNLRSRLSRTVTELEGKLSFFPSCCCRTATLCYEAAAHFVQPLLSRIKSEKTGLGLSKHPAPLCDFWPSPELGLNQLLPAPSSGSQPEFIVLPWHCCWCFTPRVCCPPLQIPLLLQLFSVLLPFGETSRLRGSEGRQLPSWMMLVLKSNVKMCVGRITYGFCARAVGRKSHEMRGMQPWWKPASYIFHAPFSLNEPQNKNKEVM